MSGKRLAEKGYAYAEEPQVRETTELQEAR
jgi:hypothetical protein